MNAEFIQSLLVNLDFTTRKHDFGPLFWPPFRFSNVRARADAV